MHTVKTKLPLPHGIVCSDAEAKQNISRLRYRDSAYMLKGLVWRNTLLLRKFKIEAFVKGFRVPDINIPGCSTCRLRRAKSEQNQRQIKMEIGNLLYQRKPQTT